MKCIRMLPLVFVLLAGCVGTMQTVDESVRSRTYGADMKTTFKAAILYFNSKGFAIVMADKELGLLNTDWKSIDRTSAILMGDARFKINLSMHEIGKETKVSGTISFQQKGYMNQWEEAGVTESTARDLYAKMFDGIQSHIR